MIVCALISILCMIVMLFVVSSGWMMLLFGVASIVFAGCATFIWELNKAKIKNLEKELKKIKKYHKNI